MKNHSREYEEKVYYALGKIDDLQAISRIANEQRMREHAPRLRQFLIDAMGSIRHFHKGKTNATMARLNLPAYPTGELVAETYVTHELQIASAEPHEEHLFFALHAAHLYESMRRLLHLAAKAYQPDGDKPCNN